MLLHALSLVTLARRWLGELSDCASNSTSRSERSSFLKIIVRVVKCMAHTSLGAAAGGSEMLLSLFRWVFSLLLQNTTESSAPRGADCSTADAERPQLPRWANQHCSGFGINKVCCCQVALLSSDIWCSHADQTSTKTKPTAASAEA